MVVNKINVSDLIKQRLFLIIILNLNKRVLKMPRNKIAGKKQEKGSKVSSGSKVDSQAKGSKVGKKSAPATGGVKTGVRKFRFRPGTVALREIKRYQKATNLLLLRAPFQRLVR